MSKKKPYIDAVFMGHTGSGKTTTAGHLICTCGGLDRRTMEKYEREAAERGQSSSKYAMIMNRFEEESCRGLGTLLVSQRKQFETRAYHVNVADSTGHRDFVKNMITGSSRADCALLLVSASSNEFEVGISQEGQLLEHTRLAHTLGIQQIIVLVNKMDTTEPPFSETRFNQIKSELMLGLTKIGYQPETIPFIPMSALHGDNVIEVSERMPWYQGWSIDRSDGRVTGKAVNEAIDAILPPQRPYSKPLRLPIEDVYKIAGVGTVAVGRVEAGVLKTNMPVNVAPVSLTAVVTSIEMHHETMEEALPGDNIGFCIRGNSARELRRGFVCSDAANDPAREAVSFTAHLIVLNHPNKIGQGYMPAIDCHTAHVACRFAELISKICRRTGRVIEEAPEYLKSGESGIVKLVPVKPMCVERFADYPPLGRFAVRDMRQTVAVGIIVGVEKRA